MSEYIDNQSIESLYDKACELLDKDHFEDVLDIISDALSLIPEPKVAYPQSLLLYIVMGDTLYYMNDTLLAMENFYKATNCPDGVQHPFVNMRIGQLYFELGMVSRCKEYLIKAYIIAKKDIFENEDPVFLEILDEALAEHKISNLNEIVSQQIDELVFLSSQEWRLNNYNKALNLLEEAWDMLPEDKLEYFESYVIACGYIENAISLKDQTLLGEWITILLNSCPDADVQGEREFIAAKAAYELADYESSLKFFLLAQKNGFELQFDINDEKYEDFFLSKTQQKTNLS